MASQIESGINTYVGHFRQLIDVCTTFGGQYNPQTPALQLTSLEAKHTAVQAAINNVDTLLPTYVAAESDRSTTFARVLPLATRVQATAIVLNLPAGIVTHIKETVRKIRGERAKKLKPEDLIDANGEPIRHSSVSQTSFNEQVEHFNQLIDLVASQQAYAPVETDLTVASLTSLLDQMRLTNDVVMSAITPLSAARQERDKALFAPQTGMVDTALAVKEYVKAVFGASSPQYKEVHHITFRNRK
jgi:hypothetical protein